jgi:hypothetical protein
VPDLIPSSRAQLRSGGFPSSRKGLGFAVRPFDAPASAQLWRMTAAIVCVGAAAILAGSATAGTFNPSNLATAELSRIGQICETVIRVQPGDEHYVGCVESLSDSVQSARQDRVVQQPSEDCLDRGFKSGSPDLARCAPESAEAQARSSTSYYYASRDDVFRREQLSCVRLGVDPVGGAFSSCVASLAGTLETIDMPPD